MTADPRVREAFERIALPNFRQPIASETAEDHWQTWQEAWGQASAHTLRGATDLVAAAVAAERDCRTCRHFRGADCDSVLRCVDSSSYQREGVVRLWGQED